MAELQARNAKFPADASPAAPAASPSTPPGALARPEQVPIMTTGGNHEISSAEGWVSYNVRYPMPFRQSGSVSNLWWSRDVGPAHVVALCSYAATDAASLQYKWLARDLARLNRTRTPWLIVMMHAPWCVCTRRLAARSLSPFAPDPFPPPPFPLHPLPPFFLPPVCLESASAVSPPLPASPARGAQVQQQHRPPGRGRADAAGHGVCPFPGLAPQEQTHQHSRLRALTRIGRHAGRSSTRTTPISSSRATCTRTSAPTPCSTAAATNAARSTATSATVATARARTCRG